MKGSYLFEKLESREAEVVLLAERARLRLDGFVDLVRRHGFPGRGRALDVGCGHGTRTRLLAEAFPEVEMIGIDRSPELLRQAIESAPIAGNLSFQREDLYDPRLPAESFDFIYCRLVFMHLEDPGRAIRSLERLLRPGGRILIEDADRDCMFFEPSPASFAWFWDKVQEGQRRLGGDPNIGRKLAPLLKQEGFQDVRIEAQPIIGGGDEIAFLVRTLLPSLNVYLSPEDRVAGESAIRELGALADDPCATFYHFWFAVSARKPQRTSCARSGNTL